MENIISGKSSRSAKAVYKVLLCLGLAAVVMAGVCISELAGTARLRQAAEEMINSNSYAMGIKLLASGDGGSRFLGGLAFAAADYAVENGSLPVIDKNSALAVAQELDMCAVDKVSFSDSKTLLISFAAKNEQTAQETADKLAEKILGTVELKQKADIFLLTWKW